MRKILIMVLIVILLVCGYFVIFNGMNVLGFDVLSVFQIKEKSEQLDSELQTVSTLTSVDQPKAIADLQENAKQLILAKEEYNDSVLNSSSDDITKATQGIQYEMEYLWAKVGNHATKNGINLKFEVRQNASGVANQYDLSFTVTGKYVAVSEFIASIENDSSLNFKIEEFKISPFEGSTDTLQATFIVKDIGIRVDQITSSGNTPTTDTSTPGTNNS